MPAQLTQRPFTFFNTNPRTATPTSPAPAEGRSAHKRRLINIQAGLAELMLLNRLRARTRPGRGGDTLERAAKIIEVTSRHWFAEPASSAGAELSADLSDLSELPELKDVPKVPKVPKAPEVPQR